MNNHNITAGTPRGFNLANMPMLTTFPPGFPPPSNFPPFPAAYGNHTVQPPPGWPPESNPFATNGDESHQPGPMRRGGGRFNTTSRQGPYDRRLQQRYGANGRLTPPRSGIGADRNVRVANGVGGAGKWGDGAGAQTVGPREAVQGRSLKSYEDLDAVGASAGGELNY